jgi:two-component system response regulator (stage 0 sporulation protein A)
MDVNFVGKIEVAVVMSKAEFMKFIEKEKFDLPVNPLPDVPQPVEVPEVKRSLIDEITVTLTNLGTPRHIKGFTYIREALLKAVKDFEVINHITKTLYPDIAVIYKTTPSRVERAIRHAIEVTWSRGQVDTLASLFGYAIKAGQEKPTNSEFLATIADNIRLKMND